MDNKNLEYFKSKLKNELRELELKADGTLSASILIDSHTADPLDRAAIDMDISTIMRIRDRESKLMQKIQESLDKIEEGTYGVCELCGEDISIARLRARPVASYCIRCKTKMESFERVSGF